jgi:rRNA maturation endonuclease Nob1
MTDGIKNIVTWVYYCPGCKRNFSKTTECPNCGNPLKRKPLKK